MPILCKPTVRVPDYVITMERTLEFPGKAPAGNPRLVRPIEETLDHPGGIGGDRLRRGASCLIPNTAQWISYAVRDTGFHFQLDHRVPGSVEPLAPVPRDLAADRGRGAGRPPILDDLATYEEDPLPTDATGVIAGFGPGITAEMALGTWVDGTPHDHGERPAAEAAPRPYAGRIV